MNRKLAIVTGATAGIGQQTSLDLAKIGYDLLILGRRQDRLLELKKNILSQSSSAQVYILPMDIRDKDKLSLWIEDHAELLKSTQILVNSAGLARGVERFQDSQWQDIEEMIETNVKALFFLTLKILPFMKKNNFGHIINLGSVAGRWVYQGGTVYCASKFAVRAFTEGLRQDLVGTAIRVSNIEPGMVNTEFSLIRLGNQTSADKVYENMTPLTAKDISETICWILQRPAHVNIQELVIYPTDQAHIGVVNRKST
ncbi:MAG: SDR family NAD(P)-dependent oxidoreductase [Bdellovibrionaceae bacterium]|nr:SDR family NAD(P)-dependent oxidoreductase [Pseudobdellovibrionaceae bacterium]NUM60268.1 SDR family NAD(P)-dependent oxidoreductase [Pseudobdellovibrionaceae bacterium]